MRAIGRYGAGIPAFAWLSVLAACPAPRAASRAIPSSAPSAHLASAASPPAAGDASAFECQNDGDCAVVHPTAQCSSRDARAVARARIPAPQRNASPTSCPADVADDSFAFCEDHRCVLHDGIEALAWARARVPAVRELSTQGARSPADAPWYTPGAHVVLYVRSDWLAKDLPKARAPRTCVGVNFVAQEGLLQADLDDRNRSAPRYGCFNHFELGVTARMLRTCREPPAARGAPDFESTETDYCLGYGLNLSTADSDGLLYDGVEFRGAVPRCRWTSVDRPGCPIASCRTCTIVLDVDVTQPCVDPDILKKPESEIHAVVDHPTCGPCLPDEQASLLPRLAAILSGGTFLEPVHHPDALRLSRDKATCESFLTMDPP